MKRRKKTKKDNSTKKVRRLPAVLVLALALLAIGAIPVVSRQLVSGKQAEPERRAFMDASGKKYITVKVAGQDVQVDTQTGQLKPLTPQEAQQLAEGLKGMLNKSVDGLVQVQQADGSVSMDLDGRFQNVTVARVNEDGTVSQSCVDNPLAAASFFGIDPKLLGVEDTASVPKKPGPTTTAKNNLQ